MWRDKSRNIKQESYIEAINDEGQTASQIAHKIGAKWGTVSSSLYKLCKEGKLKRRHLISSFYKTVKSYRYYQSNFNKISYILRKVKVNTET